MRWRLFERCWQGRAGKMRARVWVRDGRRGRNLPDHCEGATWGSVHQRAACPELIPQVDPPTRSLGAQAAYRGLEYSFRGRWFDRRSTRSRAKRTMTNPAGPPEARRGECRHWRRHGLLQLPSTRTPPPTLARDRRRHNWGWTVGTEADKRRLSGTGVPPAARDCRASPLNARLQTESRPSLGSRISSTANVAIGQIPVSAVHIAGSAHR